jgi:hypothetical protein
MAQRRVLVKIILDSLHQENRKRTLINFGGSKGLAGHRKEIASLQNKGPVKRFNFYRPQKLKRVPVDPVGTTMTSVLKTLGDDWHNPHPYVRLITSVLPDAGFEDAEAIEKRLLQVYEDEHFDFKSLKNSKPIQTLYETEIEIATSKKKHLEEEVKREEDRFNKLLEKFKEHGAPETSSEGEGGGEEEEEDEEEEDAAEAKRRGKGQKACRRTLKAEAVRQTKLVQGIKTSMASSQLRLMELNEEAERLTKLCEYYNHYNNATKCYLRSMRELTQKYSESKDVPALITSIKHALSYHEMMMRRYVPKESCCGTKGLCETHLLPLYSTVYPKDNFRPVWKCCASP